MNAKTIARLVLVFAAGLAAVTGTQAKGSMSVGLTIVSSCAVSSAHAYRAVTAKPGSAATVVAGCSNSDTSYTVSLNSAASSSAAEKVESGDAGEVRVTLTY